MQLALGLSPRSLCRKSFHMPAPKILGGICCQDYWTTKLFPAQTLCEIAEISPPLNMGKQMCWDHYWMRQLLISCFPLRMQVNLKRSHVQPPQRDHEIGRCHKILTVGETAVHSCFQEQRGIQAQHLSLLQWQNRFCLNGIQSHSQKDPIL